MTSYTGVAPARQLSTEAISNTRAGVNPDTRRRYRTSFVTTRLRRSWRDTDPGSPSALGVEIACWSSYTGFMPGVARFYERVPAGYRWPSARALPRVPPPACSAPVPALPLAAPPLERVPAHAKHQTAAYNLPNARTSIPTYGITTP